MCNSLLSLPNAGQEGFAESFGFQRAHSCSAFQIRQVAGPRLGDLGQCRGRTGEVAVGARIAMGELSLSLDQCIEKAAICIPCQLAPRRVGQGNRACDNNFEEGFSEALQLLRANPVALGPIAARFSPPH